MTALGTHEHFQCDQCKRAVRVKTDDLHRGGDIIPQSKAFDRHAGDDVRLRPGEWVLVEIVGGSRLTSIKHLCDSCRNSLDRHFFGQRTCDADKIDEHRAVLQRLVERYADRAHIGGEAGLEDAIFDAKNLLDPSRLIEVET